MGQNCVISFNNDIPHQNDSNVNYCNDTVVITSLEFSLGVWLAKNASRLCFVIGLLGNLLTILILLRTRPWRTWSVYVTVLAVTDTLVLLVKLTIYELFYTGKVLYDPGECKFILFFGITLCEFSHWVIVCMTVERFFFVWFPLRISDSNVRRAYWLLTLLAVALAFHNITYFWISGDQWNSVTGTYCTPAEHYEDFVNQYWKWIRTAVIGILPLIIVFFVNICIVTGLILSNRRHRELKRSKPNRAIYVAIEDVFKDVQVTAMIMSVSVFFSLAVLPHVLMMVSRHDDRTPVTLQLFYVWLYFDIFSDLNYCSSFFLYCATSKEYRRKMKLMICKLFTSCGNTRNTYTHRVSPPVHGPVE